MADRPPIRVPIVADEPLARQRLEDLLRAEAGVEIVASVDKPAFGAPHFVRGLVSGKLTRWQPGLAEALSEKSGVSEIHTTIEPDIQRAAENAVKSTLASLADKHVTAAAVLVLENATGDVLAYVGSPDFENAIALGEITQVPALFLIRRAGRIARQVAGYQSPAQLAQLVAPALPPRAAARP